MSETIDEAIQRDKLHISACTNLTSFRYRIDYPYTSHVHALPNTMHDSMLGLLSQISPQIKEVTLDMFGLPSRWADYEVMLESAFKWPLFEKVLARLTKLEAFICEARQGGSCVWPAAYERVIQVHLPRAYSRGIFKFVINDSIARRLTQ